MSSWGRRSWGSGWPASPAAAEGDAPEKERRSSGGWLLPGGLVVQLAAVLPRDSSRDDMPGPSEQRSCAASPASDRLAVAWSGRSCAPKRSRSSSSVAMALPPGPRPSSLAWPPWACSLGCCCCPWSCCCCSWEDSDAACDAGVPAAPSSSRRDVELTRQSRLRWRPAAPPPARPDAAAAACCSSGWKSTAW